MAKNEKTSARVAKIAAKVLMSTGYRPAVLMKANRSKENRYWTLQWHELRALAASALTQAPDNIKRYDDFGFDPREGGTVGKQYVPKRKRVLSARIKSKRPSSWPPSAKPGRNSP